MFSWLRHWFSGLTPQRRYGVSILLLLGSAGLWFAGLGWAAGLILLFFGGPSDSEKNGYQF